MDWGRIKEIYDEALLRSGDDRSAFVAKECKGDPDVAKEVNALLQADESSGDFLESPAFEMGLKIISSADNDDLVGTMVGDQYLVQRVLTEGGMGKLYLASDSKFAGRPVVIKAISQALLPDPEARRRFELELQALSRIEPQSNIVNVYNAGELSDGRPYIVMEFVDGVTLRSEIPSKGMDIQRAASILKDIGTALGYIHSRGIFHRDLKPENIMIQRRSDGSEVVKIVDFGIAKVKDSLAGSTVQGARIGTPAYMSPEQLRGETVTAACDVYALAVIACELVTGERPANPPAVPPRPGVPTGAQKLIAKGLSANPADRPQNAKQYATELHNALLRRWDTGRFLRIAAGALIVALLSYGVYAYMTWRKPASPVPTKGFNYWLMVQQMRDGKEYREPMKSSGNDTFESGDRFRLNVASLAPGFIYIFNEGPPEPGNVSFRLLYPKATINNGSANIGGNQTIETDWITFRGPEGAENLWIVWSTQQVPELESAKNEALKHPQGGLTDQNVAAVKEFLQAIKDRVDARAKRFTDRQAATVRAESDLVPVLVQVRHH